MAVLLYPHQSLSLKSLKGEKWKDIFGLEGYYMTSNLGRIKRLEYEMEYRNGIIYTKEEKIIKPTFVVSKNNFRNDNIRFLVNKVKFDGVTYHFTIARIVYYYFVERFNLSDRNIVILCRDGDGLNIHPGNLQKATLSDKSKRIFARNRIESPFKYLSRNAKEERKAAIVKKLSRQVSQYSIEGNLIRTYLSAAEAERTTGVFATSISLVASGGGFSAGGYVWKWGKEKKLDVESIRKKRKATHRSRYGQKVSQYDFRGNKIAQYPSLQDAQEATGANCNAIRLVLKGVYKSAKGYYWKKGYGKKKIDLSNYKWGKQSMATTQSKKIKQLTLTGGIIKVFPSLKRAAQSIGVSESCIIGTCKGRQKSSGGYKWQYV